MEERDEGDDSNSQFALSQHMNSAPISSDDFFDSLSWFEESLTKYNIISTTSEVLPNTEPFPQSKTKLSNLKNFFSNSEDSQGYCELLKKYVTSSAIMACCTIIGSNEKRKMEKYIILSIPYYFIMNDRHNVIFTGKRLELETIFNWFVSSMFPSLLVSPEQVHKVGCKLPDDASHKEQFLFLVRHSLKQFIEKSIHLSKGLLSQMKNNEFTANDLCSIGDDDSDEMIMTKLDALPFTVIQQIETRSNLEPDEIDVLQRGYLAMITAMKRNDTIVSPPIISDDTRRHGNSKLGRPATDLLEFVLNPRNHGKLFPPSRSSARKEQQAWCESHFVIQTSTIPNANDGLYFNKSGTLRKGCTLYYSGIIFHETETAKLTDAMASTALQVAKSIFIVGNYKSTKDSSVDYPAKLNHKTANEADWKFEKPFFLVLQRDVKGLREMFISYSGTHIFPAPVINAEQMEVESEAESDVDTVSDDSLHHGRRTRPPQRFEPEPILSHSRIVNKRRRSSSKQQELEDTSHLDNVSSNSVSNTTSTGVDQGFTIASDAFNDLDQFIAPSSYPPHDVGPGCKHKLFIQMTCIGFLRGESSILTEIDQFALADTSCQQIPFESIDNTVKTIAIAVIHFFRNKGLFGPQIKSPFPEERPISESIVNGHTVVSDADIAEYLNVTAISRRYFPSPGLLCKPYGFISEVRTTVVSGEGCLFVWPNSSCYLLSLASKGPSLTKQLLSNPIQGVELFVKPKDVVVHVDGTLTLFVPRGCRHSSEPVIGPINKTIFARECLFSSISPSALADVSSANPFPKTSSQELLEFFQEFFIFPNDCNFKWHDDHDIVDETTSPSTPRLQSSTLTLANANGDHGEIELQAPELNRTRKVPRRTPSLSSR